MSTEIQQKLLNISYLHIRRQGKPSYFYLASGVPRCAYKNSDGLSCAAVPFILEYIPGMERVGRWIDIVNNFPTNIMPESITEVSFVIRLQQCHDFSVVDAARITSSKATIDFDGYVYSAEEFNLLFMRLYKERIAILAKQFNLTLPEFTNENQSF